MNEKGRGIFKRILIWTLCLAMVLPASVMTGENPQGACAQESAASIQEDAGEDAGNFCLAAENTHEGQLIIDPVRISYEAEQTIREVLLTWEGHLFNIDSDGKLYGVDEVRGDYRLFSQAGEISLDTQAGEVERLEINTSGNALTEGKLALMEALLSYQENSRAPWDELCKQSYEAAKNSYAGAGQEEAAQLAAVLNNALDTLEERQGAGAWDGVTRTQPAVDENGVYQIGTGAELAWFAGLVNGALEGVEQNKFADAVLTADIDLAGCQWTPIGTDYSYSQKGYGGTFDGQNHRIENLYIDVENPDNALGLFGWCGDSLIQNFTLTGGIVVTADEDYENILSVAAVAGSGKIAARYGGEPLTSGSVFRNIHNECNVSAANNKDDGGNNGGDVSGIANSAEIIEGCSNKGSISGGYSNQTPMSVFGIGRGEIIRNCYNEGAITNKESGAFGTAGIGFVGTGSRNMMENCYNVGPVTAKYYVYGIGWCKAAYNCYNAGELTQTGDPNAQKGWLGSYGTYGICIFPVTRSGVSGSETCCYLELEETIANAEGVCKTREELLQAAEFLGEAFAFNGKSGHHEGYPVLSWELETPEYQNQPQEPITAADLLEGAATQLSVALGTAEEEITGLWDKILITVAGVTFPIAAVPVCEAGYDPETPGDYLFRYRPELGDYLGIYLPEGLEMPEVRVRVRSTEDLEPVIAELDWKKSNFSIAHGGDWTRVLPKVVSARIEENGESRWMLLPLTWQEPEGYTNTPEDTAEFTFTSTLPKGYQPAEEIEAPQVVLTVKKFGYLSALILNGAYHMSPDTFDASQHEYTVDVPDSVGSLNIYTALNPMLPEGSTVKWQERGAVTVWQLKPGFYEKAFIRKDPEKVYPELDGSIDPGKFPRDSTAEITVTNGETEETQVYTIHMKRIHTLSSLKITGDGSSAELIPLFTPEEQSYVVLVPDTVESVEVTAAPRYTCTVSVNRGKASETVALTGDETEISILVTHNYTGESTEYTVKVKKEKTVEVQARVTPEQAGLSIRNRNGEGIYPDENGIYHLMEGKRYNYSATCLGYISVQGRFYATEGFVLIVSLTKALKNPDLVIDLPAQWENFRGNQDNNGVSEAKTPRDADETELYWASKLGERYGANATGSPIIVDDALIFTAGRYIFRMDRFTGEVLSKGLMCGKSAYNIIPPTYGDGMIFVGLHGGTVQAFNAITLESLWIYENAWGGQPNCPITYRDGYIYTGFWNWDYEEAQFTCVPVTDEYPLQKQERKAAAWTYTHRGGFYWAGAYAGDGYVLVGTDDGQSGTAPTGQVLSFDTRTGRLLDSLTGLNGDVRCTIVHDSATGRCYFDTTGGSFYGVKVDKSGHFVEGSLQELNLNSGEAILGSTSTPVVYNGRAYLGVRGKNQFEQYSGHKIAVIDLSEEGLSIAYTCETGGYCQTSGLMSIGYVKGEDGWVYVYFIENYYPGKVRVIKDRKGETSPGNAVTESYTYQGKNYTKENCTPVLFTPQGEQMAFALGSAIVDEYGTLYFKNDSAYMMAVGSRIKSIEVTKQPDKTQYGEGETFDPAGMQVVAHLANGLTRDVTKLVTYTDQALTAEDEDVTIYYSYVAYHDKITAGGRNETGVVSDPLWSMVEISVQGTAALGDVDGDGVVTMQDAVLLTRHLSGWSGLGHANITTAVADIDGDGAVTMPDAVLLTRYLSGWYAVDGLEELQAAEIAARR